MRKRKKSYKEPCSWCSSTDHRSCAEDWAKARPDRVIECPSLLAVLGAVQAWIDMDPDSRNYGTTGVTGPSTYVCPQCGEKNAHPVERCPYSTIKDDSVKLTMQPQQQRKEKPIATVVQAKATTKLQKVRERWHFLLNQTDQDPTWKKKTSTDEVMSEASRSHLAEGSSSSSSTAEGRHRGPWPCCCPFTDGDCWHQGCCPGIGTINRAWCNACHEYDPPTTRLSAGGPSEKAKAGPIQQTPAMGPWL